MTSELVKGFVQLFKEWLKTNRNYTVNQVKHHGDHAITILNNIERYKWSLKYYCEIKNNPSVSGRIYSKKALDHWEWTKKELLPFFDEHESIAKELYRS